MKDKFDADTGPLRKRDVSLPEDRSPDEIYTSPINGQHPSSANGHARSPGKFDAWVALDLLVRRWHWLVIGGAVSAALFFLLGWHFFAPKFTASAQLLRYELPGTEVIQGAAPISPETFASIIRAPELLRRVGGQLVPQLPPETLTKLIKIEPNPDSDVLLVSLMARQPQQAVDWLNLYTREAVDYMRELQGSQAAKIANDYLKKQVEQMDGDLGVLEKQIRGMPFTPEMASVTNKLAEVGTNLTALSANLSSSPGSTLLISKQTERLTTALAELSELTSKYTELHPLVRAKEAEIANLRNQIQTATTNMSPAAAAAAMSGGLAGEKGFNPDLDIIQTKLRALADGRVQLLNRQREAAMYALDPPGVARILAPADLKTVKKSMRSLKVGIMTIFGSFMGLGASLCLIMLVEFTDKRLKTTDDIARVTRLHVLATLGDLHSMTPAERNQWAFRTWTMLQGRLSPTANHGLVCGVTSSTSGEGRSTWISLLAEAASLTGFRVLTIATRPSPSHVDSSIDDPDNVPLDPEMSDHYSTALTTNVLAQPAQVTDQLTGPNSQPVVHIPLPGWVWNLERRKQWRDALDHWRQIENLVIFVELPPAGVAEAVLLGSNLPNMVWLANSGTADAGETRAQLETLRDARCHLVGAVVNRVTTRSVKQRFPRWLEYSVLVAALSLGTARAQNPTNNAPASAEAPTNALQVAAPEPTPQTNNGSFSVVSPEQRADWQKHLTLGPGDVLNFGLYGEPDLARADVAVGPDGMVNFLEATNVLATGLTIDELRDKLDQSLGLFRRAPRTLVTPVSFRSKKYYMLGKVVVKGVYTLDRPITVLEAIARARGIESGLVDRNVVDVADFSHSFLARGGKRYPLNFEKLFQDGDLAQNIAIEPGDYVYLAPANMPEVYVVGEVRLPGPVAYTPDMTIIKAITARGGYTDRAYKMRVVVVRGSLNNPEKIVVDTHAILDAKGPNFKLKPKDIVFVNSRPFILVEELADLAATAFIQSIVSEWVGVDVVQPAGFVP